MSTKIIDPEETLRCLKEDALARDHQGYFKLWKMKLSKGRDGNWGHLPWIKDKLLGIYPSREPCETFLALLERGPEVVYEFCRFSEGVDHLPGYWEVEIDKDGNVIHKESLNHKSPEWKWPWRDHDVNYEDKNDWNNGETFRGHARTKERALELAHEAKAEFEEFVRVERPKRAEGCYCDPWSTEPCGKCEKAVVEQKKQDCGCPYCAGDH